MSLSQNRPKLIVNISFLVEIYTNILSLILIIFKSAILLYKSLKITIKFMFFFVCLDLSC